MIRGEIWTVSGAPGYGSKPRPALIVQSDILDATQSVITCGITSREDLVIPFRPAFEPTPDNGLDRPSSVMIDKIASVPRSKLGKRTGRLTDEDMVLVEQSLVLGFEG